MIPSNSPFAKSSAQTSFGVQSVIQTLGKSEATLERFAWLGDQFAIAEWTRATDEAQTAYDKPGHHTLSCYLQGGYRTERQKVPGRYGAPTFLCALPGEHESQWWVRGRMHFLHLYFLPDHFTRRAVRELDMEPRELTLADRTYFQDEQIAQLCQSLLHFDWEDRDDLLRMNEAVHQTMSLLLRSQGVRKSGVTPKGGLAVATRRRLADYIDCHLTDTLTLATLADVASLSEFHLARMFRTSFGMPPHAWIASQRLDRARGLLRSSRLPISDIAAECGFANVSHLSHRFKDALGVSPQGFRQIIGLDL
ncbi:helix-turn-helix transcriptional regulator [Robbsia sp. KACC 23696]|uniref:AraC family transcriptional regulator n=1 Tax=Robbsia sp. KACC 23696 TaxID=3149231 RepID=UPI00325AEBBD